MIIKMERDNALTKKVKRFCFKIGADIVGFADPILFKRFPKYNQPESYLKDAKTVIILGLHLKDILLDAWFNAPKEGKSFQFADSILENLCIKVKDFLSDNGFKSVVISYTPGLFLKDSSVLAGIGSIGKNNLLLTKEFGSRIRLRALCTLAPLECGEPIYLSKDCEDCNMCIESCPAKAFSSGKYNKELCLNYNLTNKTNLSNYTSIWCNECIESCPVGKK